MESEDPEIQTGEVATERRPSIGLPCLDFLAF
jgi:hypothetical protein